LRNVVLRQEATRNVNYRFRIRAAGWTRFVFATVSHLRPFHVVTDCSLLPELQQLRNRRNLPTCATALTTPLIYCRSGRRNAYADDVVLTKKLQPARDKLSVKH